MLLFRSDAVIFIHLQMIWPQGSRKLRIHTAAALLLRSKMAWVFSGGLFGWTYCCCKSVKALPLFKMYTYFFQHFHKFESTLVDVRHKRALKTAPTTGSSSLFSATLFSLSRCDALVRRHATATRTSNTTRQRHNTTRVCMFSSCTKHCSILDCITQTHEHISIAQSPGTSGSLRAGF